MKLIRCAHRGRISIGKIAVLRQQEWSGGMVCNIFQPIEHLSTTFTLDPGFIKNRVVAEPI